MIVFRFSFAMLDCFNLCGRENHNAEYTLNIAVPLVDG